MCVVMLVFTSVHVFCLLWKIALQIVSLPSWWFVRVFANCLATVGEATLYLSLGQLPLFSLPKHWKSFALILCYELNMFMFRLLSVLLPFSDTCELLFFQPHLTKFSRYSWITLYFRYQFKLLVVSSTTTELWHWCLPRTILQCIDSRKISINHIHKEHNSLYLFKP